MKAVLGNPGADHAPRSATVGFLSAPSSDQEVRAAPSSGDAHVTGNAGHTDGAVFLALTGAFEMELDSGNGSGNFRADGEPADPAERPTNVTEALTVSALLPEVVIAPAALPPQARPVAAWDAAEAVTELYLAHRNQLVRIALVLVHDMQTAEEVVQEAFESMHLAWRRLRNQEKALAYLKQTIVNRSRSELRHRRVVEMHAPKPAPDEQSAEHAAMTLIERSAVASALRALPVRQREAIVLRYYGGLSEADIAKAMGISKGAVKSHTARAMAALRVALGQGTQ